MVFVTKRKLFFLLSATVFPLLATHIAKNTDHVTDIGATCFTLVMFTGTGIPNSLIALVEN